MSVSLPDQFKEILDVVGRSLINVHAYHEKEVEDEIKRQESVRQRRERLKKIQRGEWHDGRLDCVAGNGVMSELGIGDEGFGPNDADVAAGEADPLDSEVGNEIKSSGDLESIRGLPVVVIRGFEDKVGGRLDLLDVVAQWATNLVDNRVSGPQALTFYRLIRTSPPHLDRACHRVERQPRERQTACQRWRGYCIAVAGGLHNSTANHSKPLNSIALSDADVETALAFVQQKLEEAKLDIKLTSKTTASIERLGGRASDLDSVRPLNFYLLVSCLNAQPSVDL